jgi:hypothetical protein
MATAEISIGRSEPSARPPRSSVTVDQEYHARVPAQASTKPFTVLAELSAHLCNASGDPDHVDVRANMLAPPLPLSVTASVAVEVPDVPPRILGDAPGQRPAGPGSPRS